MTAVPHRAAHILIHWKSHIEIIEETQIKMTTKSYVCVYVYVGVYVVCTGFHIDDQIPGCA